MRRALAGTLVVAASAASFADDAAPPPADAEKPKVEGDVKVGWRLLSGEDEGRFPQDHGLKDGGRLFDFNLLATDPRAGASIDEVEAKASGVGDPWTDALLTVRKRGLFEISGGWRRDESDYRASGDPFPYDLVRDRTFVHGKWTPTRDAAVRFSWDASDRRGHAFTQGYDYFTLESVAQRRSIAQETDRFSLGADYAVGILRFGLTQTVGTQHLDDSRASDAPDSTARDLTRVQIDSKTYATTGKVAAAIVPGVLDATLVVTRSLTPLEQATDGSASNDGTPPTVVDYFGEGRISRHALDWRLETSWRPMRDWEFVFAGESDDVVEDSRGIFTRGGGVERHPFSRTTDRCQRWSADATWDVRDDLRLRLGEQYLREELFVPTDSHFKNRGEPFAGHVPTDLESNALRTTAGADWSPTKKLKLSALVRASSNDEPQTTPIGDHGDEYSLRARWNPTPEWSATTLWRRQSVVHTGAVRRVDLFEPLDPAHPGRRTNLDSAGRATSVTQSAAWTQAPWTATASVTYRGFSTSADTAWGGRQLNRLVFETASFESRDVIAQLDLHYDFTKTLRGTASVSRTNATGDFAARWASGSVGAEYDVRKDLTLGLLVSTWRLLDREVPQDGYRAYGVETSLTWRF